MKSVKPGRGPSMMSGVAGIFVVVFGIVWTILAAEVGGGLFFIFGVCFVGLAIVQVIYNFKNATSQNRFSEYDITESHEESDPFNDRFGKNNEDDASPKSNRYCPYCGNPVDDNFEYCNHCGKKLP